MHCDSGDCMTVVQQPFMHMIIPPPALTASSCLIHSIVASRALVPRVASSSTALTVFSRDVTLVTITYRLKNMKKKKRTDEMYVHPVFLNSNKPGPLTRVLMSWTPNSNRLDQSLLRVCSHWSLKCQRGCGQLLWSSNV